ncbi:MAG: hypothetical protein AMXMBFR26_17170 [Porticoccaceae bacterium]
MRAVQQVFRVRRNYNRWVANQTMEDYALRFTARGFRRWSAARVSHTALGAISFLALEAIGGAITLNYGFTNAVAAILVVGLVILLTCIPISYHAARHGIDIDLLTRGASFGYIGSTITSLIYASFTFIFFALEAAIMAMALEILFGVPLSLGYLLSALLVIPLVTHGITLISRFQLWSQPVWITLQLLPLAFIVWHDFGAVADWTRYAPPGDATGRFDILYFGAASAVVFSLIAQIGEQVDFLRFLPDAPRRSARWWLSMLAGGPGWAVLGMAKILIGSFLAILALGHGIPREEAGDPTRMYAVAFGYVTHSPNAAVILAGAFVILSQLKINVTNAYAGSIAWSNFFARLTHDHPGRVVWLVFNVGIALILMELGIYRALEDILGIYAIVALAWVGSLVADLVINRPLGLRPPQIEFKRAHLYDINPVGVGSLVIATLGGVLSHAGAFGATAHALSSFIALGLTFVASPLLAWLTGGRYYIARPAAVIASDAPATDCCICEHRFEPEDMSLCPAYDGPICSLCCSLDARCNDRCKTGSRFFEQLHTLLSTFLPERWVAGFNSRIGNFIGLFLLITTVVMGVLSLIYFQVSLDMEIDRRSLVAALWKVSFILMILCGVVAWMFVLVHNSRKVAQEESQRQTLRLMDEIAAHEATDLKLQQAKEAAEAANLAKSRYLTGISHELRSPLNAVLGYAQLLERDDAVPASNRTAIGVIRRSGEYLADLIEGLLDISRIEAGRLELYSGEVRLPLLLDQLGNLFRPQAEAKGIAFSYECTDRLPEFVRTDEKRLRQILINLLSNAIKFTDAGSVTLRVRYRSQVAEFTVSDTGIGIAEIHRERIFRPFERIREAGSRHVPGTGLGLTITRLLVEILGGDLSFTSKPGRGSSFRVALMLSRVERPATVPTVEPSIDGYRGERKALLVIDDDPVHRRLVNDMLSPLGFTVVEAPDAATGLALAERQPPELFLLDVAMPGMDGWQLAALLRARLPARPIIMVSADAREGMRDPRCAAPHDAYLVKPVRIQDLLDALGSCLDLTWHYRRRGTAEPPRHMPLGAGLASRDRDELRHFAEIGYTKAFQAKLDSLEQASSAPAEFIAGMRELSRSFEFGRIVQLLGSDP